MKKTFEMPELELLRFDTDRSIMVDAPDVSESDPWGAVNMDTPFKLGLPERVDLNEYFKK